MFNKIKNYISVLILAVAGWFSIFKLIKFVALVNSPGFETHHGTPGQMIPVFWSLSLIVFFFVPLFPLILLVFLEDYLKGQSKFLYQININLPVYDWFIKIGLFGILAPVLQSILMTLAFI